MKKPLFRLGTVKQIDEEQGIISFVLTTDDVDRDGDVVIPMGVQMENFLKNPVFLWAHDLTIPPLGKILTDTIIVTEKNITADVKFDLNDPFAKLIFNKYVEKYLNAGSIRFIPKSIVDPIREDQYGFTFAASELLEFSAVPVPANQNALAKAYNDRLKSDEDKQYWNFVKSLIPDVEKQVNKKTGENEMTEEQIKQLVADSVKEAVGKHILVTNGLMNKIYQDIHRDNVLVFPVDEMKCVIINTTDTTPSEENILEELKEYCTDEHGIFDVVQYSKFFAHVDGPIDDLSSFKYLHHQLIDGEPVAVWEKVADVMNTVLSDEDMDSETKKQIYNHLSKHYTDVEKEVPELTDTQEFGEDDEVKESDLSDEDVEKISSLVVDILSDEEDE